MNEHLTFKELCERLQDGNSFKTRSTLITWAEWKQEQETQKDGIRSEWDGKGLPPVGAVVEYGDSNGWIAVHVLGHHRCIGGTVIWHEP